jgi:hypothetical protein
VNEINGHTPDALFLLLKPGEQLHLLRDYESMMNTGLCICIESLKQLIIEETRPIPGWIRFLHLESVYHWFNKEERIESQIEGNLFKKRITEDAMTDTEQYEQNKL